ncbi:Transmembrane protein ENSP00000343375 [Heterocephalus glaber]|uniref:Transmembrane protein ENSP00000343375 n=1 Tax=Heterocephalus glaber TaxID=10181 RepID=G5C9T3_HETGA|nr:Transmembrane protein ENSP00000343375 [Heterocephalus glaber]
MQVIMRTGHCDSRQAVKSDEVKHYCLKRWPLAQVGHTVDSWMATEDREVMEAREAGESCPTSKLVPADSTCEGKPRALLEVESPKPDSSYNYLEEMDTGEDRGCPRLPKSGPTTTGQAGDAPEPTELPPTSGTEPIESVELERMRMDFELVRLKHLHEENERQRQHEAVMAQLQQQRASRQLLPATRQKVFTRPLARSADHWPKQSSTQLAMLPGACLQSMSGLKGEIQARAFQGDEGQGKEGEWKKIEFGASEVLWESPSTSGTDICRQVLVSPVPPGLSPQLGPKLPGPRVRGASGGACRRTGAGDIETLGALGCRQLGAQLR